MFKKRSRNFGMIGLMICLVFLVLAGCGTNSSNTNGGATNQTTQSSDQGSTTNSTTNSSDQTSSADTTTSQDVSKTTFKQTRPLVVYANDFDQQIGPMFKKATGYDIQVVHGGGGKILSRLQAEQGNPKWDVVWMDGQASIYGLAQKDFFETGWKPKNLTNLNPKGQSLIPSNDAYFPTDIHAAAIIAYNTKVLSAAQAPKTWDDFLHMKKPIGMADPGVAAPAYPVASWFFDKFGTTQAKSIFTNLFKKNNLKVYPKNGPLGNALKTGDIAAAALQESNAYELQQAGEPVKLVWPSEGSPGSVRVAAIRKGTDNLVVAQAFVEFLLDPNTYKQLTALKDDSDSFLTPLVKGVNARSDRQVNPNITLPDVKWASENETSIKTWFANQSAN